MDAGIKLTQVTVKNLHADMLPPATRKAFLAFTTFDGLTQFPWYLAGGTALALQAGHRQSVDLDFFAPEKDISASNIERLLFITDKWTTTFTDAGTLYGEYMGAKVSFIAYPFFQPLPRRIQCGSVRILFPGDIAAMKIIAISQRGRKRDFIDLYWYCSNREPLIDIIQRAVGQYPGQANNMTHILKSLVYFSDADNDPMPHLFFEADWKTIKAYFISEVPRVAKKLLQLD